MDFYLGFSAATFGAEFFALLGGRGVFRRRLTQNGAVFGFAVLVRMFHLFSANRAFFAYYRRLGSFVSLLLLGGTVLLGTLAQATAVLGSTMLIRVFDFLSAVFADLGLLLCGFYLLGDLHLQSAFNLCSFFGHFILGVGSIAAQGQHQYGPDNFAESHTFLLS